LLDSLLILFAIVVALYGTVSAHATLAKAQFDVQALASAVERYQAHMGAPPATLAELTSRATNARGETGWTVHGLDPNGLYGIL